MSAVLPPIAATAFLLLALISPCRGNVNAREPVTFTVEFATGVGGKIHLLGDLPELGEMDPARSIEMIEIEDDQWQVIISLPVNSDYHYAFYNRTARGLGTPISDEMFGTTSVVELEPANKIVHWFSSMESPTLHWRQDDGDFTALPMERRGDGRSPEESHWVAEGFGLACQEVAFYFSNADGSVREPEEGAEPNVHSTKLDECYIRDGQLFSYLPAPVITPARRDYDPANPPFVDSTVLGEPRHFRVFLPRGYTEHEEKHYPVIYFNDGQAIFDEDPLILGRADSPYEGLDPDGEVLASLTNSGQIREVIAVGVDIEANINRNKNLFPAVGGGAAEDYVHFVISELKPVIDADYRTLTGPEHTVAVGFDLSAITALFMAWDYPEVFGKTGLLSPDVNAAKAYAGLVQLEAKRPIDIYLDSGVDDRPQIETLRSRLLSKRQGAYVLEHDLRYYNAEGLRETAAEHRQRLPRMLSFLLPATDEPGDGSRTDAPDPYWLQHFRLTPADWEIDADGDGLTTRVEYYFGTDPLDVLSRPLIDTGIEEREARFRWLSRRGVMYAVEQSADLQFWEMAEQLTGDGEPIELAVSSQNMHETGMQFYRMGALEPMDLDNDGLSDVEEEILLGTDPHHDDTDRDGYADGDEVLFLFTDPLVPNGGGGSIVGSVVNDDDGDGETVGEQGVAGAGVFLDTNLNGQWDEHEARVLTDASGDFEFRQLAPGSYRVYQELPDGWLQTLPAGTLEAPDGLADTLVEFFHSGEGTLPEPYGKPGDPWGVRVHTVGVFTPRVVDPALVLKPLGDRASAPPIGLYSTTEYVSLSKRSTITVKFDGEEIIDGPGDDFAVVTLDNQNAGEIADLWVGASLDDLRYLRAISEGGSIGVDLARYGIDFPIQYIKIESLNNGGTSPGIDLTGFEAINYLPRSNAYHLAVVEINQTTSGVDFGRVGRDLPPNVFITSEGGALLAGGSLVARVTATDDFGIASVNLTVNGSAVILDESGSIVIETPLPGELILEAEAIDTTGQSATTAFTPYVRNADGSLPFDPGSIPSSDGDWKEGAPLIDVTSPATGSVLKAPAPIVASITGGQVGTWQVHYAPLDLIDPYSLSADDADYMLLGEGEGTALGKSLAVFPADSLEDGLYFIRVTAEGLKTAYQGLVVGKGIDEANLRPVITFTAPEPDAEITYLTDIVGSISSQHAIREWYVEFAPGSEIDPNNIDGPGPAFVRIAEGAGTVNEEVLATFDPTLLPNDNYFIRVVAWNDLGLGRAEGTFINVCANAKMGRLRLEFTDLDIPLAGMPIKIRRIYDSLDAGRSGDFGYGWSLAMADADIRETVPDTGTNAFSATPFRDGTRVYLTSPLGQRIGFTFRAEQGTTSLFGASYRAVFEPDPGVYETLEVPEGDASFLSVFEDGTVGLFFIGLPYNPDRYILTTPDQSRYTYDQREGLIEVEDPNGNRLVFDHDGIRHTTGVSIAFTRDAAGRIIDITGPGETSWRYAYDAVGDLVKVTDPSGVESALGYHTEPAHFLGNVNDPLGRTALQYEYDENGRLAAVIDNNGNRSEQVWDLEGFTGTVTNGRGQVTQLGFNERGNLLRVEDPLGGITTYSYDDVDNPDLETSITDPNDNTTLLTYNEHGRLLTRRAPNGDTRNFAYDDSGRTTLMVDPDGRRYTYVYDEKGNLVDLASTGRGNRFFTYTADGQIASMTDAEGQTRFFKYNAYGQPREVTAENGAVASVRYNERLQPVAFTDHEGFEFSVDIDDLGRVLGQTDALGNASSRTYTSEGLLESVTDRTGKATLYAYDAAGRLLQETSPGSAKVTYTYDEDGNQIGVEDALGNKTMFSYNANNALVSITDALGKATHYKVDPAGNVIEVINKNGLKRSFEYDTKNRRIAERWHDAEEDSEIIREILFAYDKTDRIASVTDGETRHVISSTLMGTINKIEVTYPEQVTQVMTFGYDLEGNRTYTRPGTTSAVQLEFTPGPTGHALMAAWRMPDGIEGRVELQRDGRGRVVEMRRFNRRVVNNGELIAKTMMEYDALGLIRSMIHQDAEGELFPGTEAVSYERDAEGRITALTEGTTTSTYVYDDDGQLTEVLKDGMPIQSYAYDLLGNRKSSPWHDAYATGPGNRLNSAGNLEFAWDAEGNMIQRRDTVTGEIVDLTYDHRNRLVEIHRRDDAESPPRMVASYGYDYLNRRISKTLDGDTVWTVYDESMPAYEFHDGEAEPSVMYLYGKDRIDDYYGIWRRDSGMHWFLTDHLGGILRTLDAEGETAAAVSYDAFGVRISLESADPASLPAMRFAGSVFDEESGLYHLRARYYDPMIGRFLSPDPLGFEAGDVNLYRYVGNSPLHFTDPTGELAAVEWELISSTIGNFQTLANACAAAVNIADAFIGVSNGLQAGLFKSPPIPWPIDPTCFFR